ncbi:MAG: type II secretion system protein [Candidatus Hinthialibacter antarcticus]|nr:type II secretion system protein [Candidatus Hinthialibacter antarcticus]
MRTKRRAENSFSLVEALAAMTIMGIAIASILTTFSASLVASRVAEDYAISTSMMTELRTHVRANMLSPLDANQGTFTNHPGFSWSAVYTPTNYTNFYLVEMTIDWIRGDKEYARTCTTYHYYMATTTTTAEESEA